MGSLSVWHWLLFLAVALLMFGGSGKISSIMGDVAKGIKSFKKGMAEDEAASPPRRTSRRRSSRARRKPIEQHAAAEAQQGRLERQELTARSRRLSFRASARAGPCT